MVAAAAGAANGGGGMSFPAYFLLSTSVAAAVVGYAFQTRAQFYPAVIYLVTSKPAMLVLGNMGTCVVIDDVYRLGSHCGLIDRSIDQTIDRRLTYLLASINPPHTRNETAGLAATLLWGRVFKAAFLGPLRDVEVEILYDNARYAITETCLALTIFREELTTRCVRTHLHT
jgi:E3 ubiquitin-protein ligase synoviolin